VPDLEPVRPEPPHPWSFDTYCAVIGVSLSHPLVQAAYRGYVRSWNRWNAKICPKRGLYESSFCPPAPVVPPASGGPGPGDVPPGAAGTAGRAAPTAPEAGEGAEMIPPHPWSFETYCAQRGITPDHPQARAGFRGYLLAWEMWCAAWGCK